jgi:hypothetical protein
MYLCLHMSVRDVFTYQMCHIFNMCIYFLNNFDMPKHAHQMRQTNIHA